MAEAYLGTYRKIIPTAITAILKPETCVIAEFAFILTFVLNYRQLLIGITAFVTYALPRLTSIAVMLELQLNNIRTA
jgi:hypothetical protein